MAHTRRFAAALIAAGLFAPGAARAAAVIRGQDSRIPLSPNSPDAPYTPPASLQAAVDLFRRMTTPVRLNGQGPFDFVVDTGANQTVLSAELAARLGLPVGEPSPLNGVAGVQMTGTVHVKTLSVGPSLQTDVVLSVLPEASIGGAGLLGVDGLDGKSLTLDFKARRLRIEASEHAWRDPYAVKVAAQSRAGRLTIVDADLNGTPVRAFLDSGAQRSIGNRAMGAVATRIAPSTAWTTAPIISATGQTTQGDVAVIPAIRIGGLLFQNLQVAFADLHIFRLWDLVDQPAILLGVDVLSRFSSVALDFPRGEVRFGLPQQS